MSETPLRILVAADARSVHTARFATELRRQGCEVLVVSLEAGEIGEHRLKRRAPTQTLAYWLAKSEAEEIVARFQPDIISAHYASGYGYLMSRVRHSGIPLSLHVWGSDILLVPHRSLFHRRKIVRALAAADQVFADSDYLAGEVRALGGAKVSVFPWGIERRHLALHKTDYRLGQPLAIIVPRPHEPVYNNRFILEALKDEISREAIQITFPGFGSLHRRFREYADRLTGGRVKFYEKLPREEFLRFFAAHDVYLSAARSDSSPASLIEAMALGLVPVAADVPGVREWLDADSGYRFPPGDSSALRTIIAQLVGGATDHADIRRANLARVKRTAIFEDNVAAQLAIMRSLIREGAR